MSVGRVVLVGRDAAFWLVARALSGALAGSGRTLQLVELPSALQPGEAIAASPSIVGLHHRLGFDTDALVRAAGGQFIGGQYFRGWGPADFLLGNEEPVMAGGIDIGQYWAAERLAGATVPRDRLSPAAVAMARGRVPDDKGRFATAAGFHLDAAAYVAALRVAAGLAVRPSSGCQTEYDGERLVALTLDDGERIEGDLFIDASCAAAVLASASPQDDWRARTAIPTRSLGWTSAPPLSPRPPFTEFSRTDAGWQARYPLAGRTAICTANDPGGAPFEAGLRTPWQGNLVAIGDAACRVEPVDQLALHAVHVGIANLIAWFPASEDMAAERERHNLSVVGQFEQMLDYQQCRFGPDRQGERSLARRLALFEALGTVPAIDNDPFEPGQWERYFAGLGVIPRAVSVQAMAVPVAERHALLASLVAEIDRDAAGAAAR